VYFCASSFLPQVFRPGNMGKGYNAAIASNPYIVGSFACIGGGLFGLDISSMSGVLSNDAYKRTFGDPSPNVQGAIVSVMPAGSFAGALLVSYMADRIGRKKTVILSGIIWIIGSTLQCAAVVCTSPSFSHVYPEPSNRIV